MMGYRFLLRRMVLLGALCSVGSAFAETLTCPSAATLVQVGACPGEDDLRYTYRGYCSDNQRMYDKEQLCLDYETYRAAKNVSLWESPDGRFAGYLSCALSEGARAQLQARELSVSKQGALNKVACHYDQGVVLTYRSKQTCVAEATACATDASACKARCD